MQSLNVFSYEGNEVRTIYQDGETWWVLKDVCNVLGLSNPTIVADRLDEDERAKFDLGRQGETNIVNESGLYNVILRSDKLAAKKFKRWVTHEVLPSIRKHGLYAADELLANPDLFIRALQELKSERAKAVALTARVAVQEQQIAEMKPKAGYYDVVLACKNAVPMRVIAKDYGWSAQRMNAFLHENGIQYKQGGVWLLYQNHAKNGYTDTKTHVHQGHDGSPKSTIHTYWTQKGRLFIYEKMKTAGYLPLIEIGTTV